MFQESEPLFNTGKDHTATHAEIIAEQAHIILVSNIRTIKNVYDWSELAGYSRSWLHRCIKYRYKKTPNELLREVRYHAILSCVKKEPDALAKHIAEQVAPHWCEKRLFGFLSEYKQTNFTEIRLNILKENLP